MSTPSMLLNEYQTWVRAQRDEARAAYNQASEENARELFLELEIRKKVKGALTSACRDGDISKACARMHTSLARIRRWAKPAQLPFVEEAERRFHELDTLMAENERKQKNRAANPPFCPGKVRFRTELDAKIALANIKRKRHRRAYEERRCYYCVRCKAWHLTHKDLPHKKRN